MQEILGFVAAVAPSWEESVQRDKALGRVLAACRALRLCAPPTLRCPPVAPPALVFIVIATLEACHPFASLACMHAGTQLRMSEQQPSAAYGCACLSCVQA